MYLWLYVNVLVTLVNYILEKFEIILFLFFSLWSLVWLSYNCDQIL